MGSTDSDTVLTVRDAFWRVVDNEWVSKIEQLLNSNYQAMLDLTEQGVAFEEGRLIDKRDPQKIRVYKSVRRVCEEEFESMLNRFNLAIVNGQWSIFGRPDFGCPDRVINPLQRLSPWVFDEYRVRSLTDFYQSKLSSPRPKNRPFFMPDSFTWNTLTAFDDDASERYIFDIHIVAASVADRFDCQTGTIQPVSPLVVSRGDEGSSGENIAPKDLNKTEKALEYMLKKYPNSWPAKSYKQLVIELNEAGIMVKIRTVSTVRTMYKNRN